MIRILHLFDDGAGWEQRVGASQLIDRLPAKRYAFRAAATDGRLTRSILPPEQGVDLWPRPFGIDALGAPAMRRYLRTSRVRPR